MSSIQRGSGDVLGGQAHIRVISDRAARPPSRSSVRPLGTLTRRGQPPGMSCAASSSALSSWRMTSAALPAGRYEPEETTAVAGQGGTALMRPRSRVGERRRSMASAVAVLGAVAVLSGLPTVTANFAASTSTTSSMTAYSLSAPTALGATGTSTVSLSWTATTSGSATGTRVFRGTASGGPYTQIAQIAGLATTSTTDSPGTGTFYYVVEAYYDGGGANWTSPDSNQAAVTITPIPAFVKTVGTASCGGTSDAVTVPAGGVAAGHTLIVRLSNRSNNVGAVSASDSKGNTYTLDADIL